MGRRIAPHPEFHRTRLAQGRGIGERGQIGRPVGDMHAIEQVMAMQLADLGAEQRLRRGRNEQHRAVASVPGDDVGHVARQEAIAILLGVQQPEARSRQGFGAEREAGGVERRRDDAERRERARFGPVDRRQQRVSAEEMQQPCRHQRKCRCQRDDPARRRQRGLERHHHEPDRGERGDAAGFGGDRRDEPGQRQRREHVRAFVLPGARQVIGGEDRQHQPGEHQHFERARHAAQSDIDRKCRERHDAAQKPRRDEGAMTRRGQRIAERRRMHQRIDIVADRLEQAHAYQRTPVFCGRAPLLLPDRVRGHLNEC